MISLRERLHGYIRKLLMPLGFDFYLKHPARKILEQTIFPYYLKQSAVNNVVSIGADWYNRGYLKMWRKKNYRVIELDHERSALYAGKNAVCGSCTEFSRYFLPASLDLVFFVGVYGWGVNTMDDFNSTITGIHRCLREGGELVFGWDANKPAQNPIGLAQTKLTALFDEKVFPPLAASRYLTKSAGGHTFLFLVKR